MLDKRQVDRLPLNLRSCGAPFLFQETCCRVLLSQSTLYLILLLIQQVSRWSLRMRPLQLSHSRTIKSTSDYLYSRSVTFSHWNSLDSEFIRQSKTAFVCDGKIQHNNCKPVGLQSIWGSNLATRTTLARCLLLNSACIYIPLITYLI